MTMKKIVGMVAVAFLCVGLLCAQAARHAARVIRSPVSSACDISSAKAFASVTASTGTPVTVIDTRGD